MQRLHTEQQIEALNLPGFRSTATIDEITAPNTDWQPVMSLSIFRRNSGDPDMLDVLTAVRTPDTPTHGNVTSTPTGRFPKAFEAAVIAEKRSHMIDRPAVRLDQLTISETEVTASLTPNIEDLPGRDSPFTYLSHEIFARKLGLGDALQNKKGRASVLGTLSLRQILLGFSWAANHAQTGEPLWEPITMYAGAVMLDAETELPKTTTAFSHIGWTPVTDFLEGHISRQSRLIVPTLEPATEIDVCVRGFCLATTSSVTRAPALQDHLGLPMIQQHKIVSAGV